MVNSKHMRTEATAKAFEVYASVDESEVDFTPVTLASLLQGGIYGKTTRFRDVLIENLSEGDDGDPEVGIIGFQFLPDGHRFAGGNAPFEGRGVETETGTIWVNDGQAFLAVGAFLALDSVNTEQTYVRLGEGSSSFRFTGTPV